VLAKQDNEGKMQALSLR